MVEENLCQNWEWLCKEVFITKKTMVTVLVIFLSLIAEIIIKESNFTLFLS